jgi:PAS domain S-box-containing protein
VDFNHAAQAACGLSPERSIGVTPDTLPPDWAGLFQRYHDVSACKEEVTIGPAERQRVYDLTVSPVQDGRSRTLGRLFLLHDVTERTRGEEELRRAKEEWEYTFDAVPDLIALLDTEHRIVRVNRAMAERLGHRPEECVGQICYKCIHGTAAPPAFCPHTQLLQDGNAHEAEVHEERLGGDYIVTVSPLRDAHGQLVGCVHVAHDITARKQAEEIIQLRLKLLEFAATHSLDELMQHALDEIGRITSSPIGFYHFVEADQKTLSLQAWSTRTRQEFCKAEGQGLHYSIDEAGVWVDCVHQRKPVIHNNYAALPHRKGMPPGHAEVIRELVVPILREGRVVSILGVGNKPFDYDDQDVAFVSYTADIIWETVKRKRAEESLREANLVVENSPVVLFRWKATEGWPVEMVSQNVSQLGYTPEELLSGAAPFASMVYPEDLDRVAREVQEYAASGTDQFQQEYRIVTKDGRVRWIDDRTSVERNIAGQIVFYQGVVIDITARKQAEEQLRASLQEKEVLLQEVHHRVKNNLQVISSLLDIQTLQNPDPQVLQALRDSQSRIRTMALVHEQLYRSADLARVNLADYIRSLASYLFSVYADRAAGVTLDVQVEDVTLGLDAAIPCGLIVGELVSNALKYAFPLTGDTPPARGVRIAMRSPGAGQFVLTISDNGVGLPPNLDVQDPPTLGLRLVSLLTQQLQGTLAVEQQPGTAFTIAFAERKRGRE